MAALKDFFTDTWLSLVRIAGAIEFKDIVDILLVAVVIFCVLRFIRDRRAGKLALGVALLFLIQIFSDIFSLVTLQFIMQNVLQVGIIALVIIFTPELRSALEKIGGSSLRGLKSITDSRENTELTKIISDVCEAACEFSKEKTGALIVFERTTKLGDIISSGVTVNADVSSFLLRNIFYNKAPLHDGAVIIRDARVFAAGCFLPLSTNMDIVKDLGTRHRAAIGMSENSDAVVLVVSEETGTISVAVEGKLFRNLDYAKLKKLLTELLGGLPTAAAKMRSVLRFKEKAKNSEDKNDNTSPEKLSDTKR